LLRGCRRNVFLPQMTQMNTDAELRGCRRNVFLPQMMQMPSYAAVAAWFF